MSPGPTFDRVYLALKGQLMCGRFAPGEHLEPVAIGEELHSSITPVRDALHRLVGERMVEAPRNDGFRVPMPTEAELRDLYGWNRELAALGLRRSSVLNVGTPPILDARNADRAAYLFRRIAHCAASYELELAVEGLSDRLAAMRTVETGLFGDSSEELDDLFALLADGNSAALRRGLSIYHKRRQRAVPDLLVAARQSSERS